MTKRTRNSCFPKENSSEELFGASSAEVIELYKPSRRLYLADAYCARELAVKNAVAVELHMQPFLAMHGNPDEAMKVRRPLLRMGL
jgi:hypothetical protein